MLVALSDPRMWALQSSLVGTPLLAGVDEFPPFTFGYTMQEGMRPDERMPHLLAGYRQTPSALEHYICHVFAFILDGSDYAWETREPAVRPASDISWELRLFSREMLERVVAHLRSLLAHGRRSVRPNGRFVFEIQSADFEVTPMALHMQARTVFVYEDRCQQLIDLIQRHLAVGEQLRDYGSYARSGAASAFRHRFSEFKLDGTGDRQGRDLSQMIGPYVSGAISTITPVPTAPVSNAQRLADLARQAERAVIEAEGDHEAAMRSMRSMAAQIKALSQSVDSAASESHNKRHKH